ncbi:MAG: hypothetical protein WA823_00220 [Candidatus Acidiferrales bacterium]
MRVDHRSGTPHHIRYAAEVPFTAKPDPPKVVVLMPDQISSLASTLSGTRKAYKPRPRVIIMRLRHRRVDDVEVWGPEAA